MMSQQGCAKHPTVRCTEYETVLFSDDHTSEGFLAPLCDGRILLVFRLDPGLAGNHVGTNAYIARMAYDPRRDAWGEVEPVYDSHQYDDRNIHGGATRDGRIVAFFRHYDGRETQGRCVMHSDDGGQTWSQPRLAGALRGVQGTGQMFYNPDIDRYCILQYERHRNEILYSPDGVTWQESRLVAKDPNVELTEIAGAWCGDGRIVALIRDDTRERGHPLLQVVSRDNGKTWSRPCATNMPPDQHWGCAPQLIYDPKHHLLIAITSDRYFRPDAENRLYIYTARPEDILDDPGNWTLQHALPRPWATERYSGRRPLNSNLYGYPSVAPISEDEYLVVFTERARMEGTEQADLICFRVTLE